MTCQCSGLDNPSCTITAKGSDDTEVTIQIGNLNSYNSDYYAKVEGSDDIYTIASSYVSDISNDISALQEKESFPTITSTSITDVQLVKDGTTIDMEKEDAQTGNRRATENASEEAETGSEVSEEETTKAVSGIAKKD